MDTLLENMDHARGPGGMPQLITGKRALIQRLLIRLSVRKGSFLPDPDLGSELYKLPARDPALRDRLALHWAQEALLPEGVTVKSASCRITAPETLSLSVTAEAGGERYPLEVSL